MTPKQRVYSALAHEETDLIPYNVPFMPEARAKVDEYYGGPDQWRASRR